mgnify:CR=1 FL=1
MSRPEIAIVDVQRGSIEIMGGDRGRMREMRDRSSHIKCELALVAGNKQFKFGPIDPASAEDVASRLTAVFDAADECAAWSAELLDMAAAYDRVAAGAFGGGAYASVIAQALRDAAASPPQGEEAFRFRLCRLLDWHPRRNAGDLDAAIARARARVSS